MIDLSPHAEAAAANDYWCFPLRPGTKAPYRDTRGLYDASIDIRTVLQLWDRYGRASNIGVVPARSHAFIFDIDSKSGADPEDVLTELELDLGDLAIVWTARAGEPDGQHPNSLAGVRGAHVWFAGEAPTGKVSIRGCEIRGGVGEDHLAYGLLPPSVHPCGDRYEGEMPRAGDLPNPPKAVLELIATVQTVSLKVPDGTIFTEPGRHEKLLAWSRSRYTAHGVLGEAALMGMLGKNAESCRPPLPREEVERLWRHLEKTRIANRERAVARIIQGWQEAAG